MTIRLCSRRHCPSPSSGNVVSSGSPTETTAGEHDCRWHGHTEPEFSKYDRVCEGHCSDAYRGTNEGLQNMDLVSATNIPRRPSKMRQMSGPYNCHSEEPTDYLQQKTNKSVALTSEIHTRKAQKHIIFAAMSLVRRKQKIRHPSTFISITRRIWEDRITSARRAVTLPCPYTLQTSYPKLSRNMYGVFWS